MSKLIALLLLVSSFSMLYTCRDPRNANATPQSYKYRIRSTALARYSDDTTAVRPILFKMLVNQTKPFNLKTYDEGTDLFIDSLIYSPDQYRMIVLVVAKNSSMKLSLRENGSPYFFDAYYLFCSRQSLKEPIKVYDYDGYGLSTFYDYTEIREALREYCFSRMMRKERDEQYYNIDDKRFWSSKYFERVLSNSTPTSDDR